MTLRQEHQEHPQQLSLEGIVVYATALKYAHDLLVRPDLGLRAVAHERAVLVNGDDVLRDRVVLALVELVEHDEEQVEARHDGRGQVEVLA